MSILGISVNVGLLAIVFAIGRAFEKWTSGIMDIEECAYNAGYDEGKKDGYNEARWELKR